MDSSQFFQVHLRDNRSTVGPYEDRGRFMNVLDTSARTISRKKRELHVIVKRIRTKNYLTKMLLDGNLFLMCYHSFYFKKKKYAKKF